MRGLNKLALCLTLLMVTSLFSLNLFSQNKPGKTPNITQKVSSDVPPDPFDDGGFSGPGADRWPCYYCTSVFSREVSYCVAERDIAYDVANSSYVSCIALCMIQNSEASPDGIAGQGLCSLDCGATLWEAEFNANETFNRCVDTAIYINEYCRQNCEP
jgi:hypothetical protein